MEFKGSRRLPALREAVWAALGDPVVHKECIPGCQSVERIDGGTMRIVVAVEVGAFKATFTGQARLTDADPPQRGSVSGEGRGRPGGSARGSVDVDLVEERGGTMVSYVGDVEVGGQLAKVPAALIATKASALADQFFSALADWLRKHHGGFVDRLDHTPAGVPLLGDEPSERVVEDKAERAGAVAEAVEERVELAAGEGLLGGPYVWGVLALAIMIAVLGFLYR